MRAFWLWSAYLVVAVVGCVFAAILAATVGRWDWLLLGFDLIGVAIGIDRMVAARLRVLDEEQK